MAYQAIRLERDGAAARLTLNRPEARNALDMAMRTEMLAALDEIEADSAVRVLVLAGAGGHFCAGGDMKSLRAKKPTAQEHGDRVRVLNRLVLRLLEFPRPTIAMVEGYALGSGCNLALCCDMVVAAGSARFGQVFGKVGLVPDGGSSWLLPRIVGHAKAREMIFTGDIFGAAEAAAMGLVGRVVEASELEATTVALARKIAAGPPKALAAAKLLLNRAVASDLATALEAEAVAQGVAVTGEEHAEGLAALAEKRAPRF